MSGLEHTLYVVPLGIPVLGNVGLEVNLPMGLLFPDHENVAAIHRGHQNALGAEQVVVSFIIFGLPDLLDDERYLDVLGLLDHGLVDQILLWLSTHQLIGSLLTQLVLELPLLPQFSW